MYVFLSTCFNRHYQNWLEFCTKLVHRGTVLYTCGWFNSNITTSQFWENVSALLLQTWPKLVHIYSTVWNWFKEVCVWFNSNKSYLITGLIKKRCVPALNLPQQTWWYCKWLKELYTQRSVWLIQLKAHRHMVCFKKH